MYSIGLYLVENTSMEFEVGDIIQLGMMVVTAGVLYGIIKTRQDAQEKRIDTLEAMINNQIAVDNGIKDVLTKLEVGQAAMTEQIKSLVHRLDKREN
jgi:uncharacterized coiled-coil protein SlyX